MNKYLKNIGKNAQKAFNSKINTKKKNKVLKKFLTLIKKNKLKIINQNKKDVNLAKKRGLRENLVNRLELNSKKIDQIVKSINNISKLKDPINITLNKWRNHPRLSRKNYALMTPRNQSRPPSSGRTRRWQTSSHSR